MANSVLLHVDESTKGIIDELMRSFPSSNIDICEISNAVVEPVNGNINLLKGDIKKIKEDVDLLVELYDEGNSTKKEIETISSVISSKVTSMQEDTSREFAGLKESSSQIEGKVSQLLDGDNSVSNIVGAAAETIKESLGGVSTQVSELEGRLDSSVEKMTSLQTEGVQTISSVISSKVTSMQEDTSREFADLKESSSQIEGKVSQLLYGDNSVSCIVGKSNEEILALIKCFEGSFQDEVNTIKNSISEIGQKSIDNNTAIESLNKRIDDVEQSITAVLMEFNSVRENQKAILKTLTTIKEEVTPFWRSILKKK